VVVGEAGFADTIARAMNEILRRRRDPDRLLVQVADMRRRIDKELAAQSLWDVKQLRGGLVDLDFLAQYLQLRHAEAHPGVLDVSVEGAFAKLAEAGLLGRSTAGRLIAASRLMRAVQSFLRLTAGETFDEDRAPEGLKSSLARAAEVPDFASLKESLITTAQGVFEVYDELVEAPAREAAKRIEGREKAAQNASEPDT
jgi:glutamate-ammonia-ligase adenylyltransferase